MPLLKRITRLFGDGGGPTGGAATDREAADEAPAEPSHVCRSCGKKYFADPELNIHTCQGCGGVKVERV